MERDATIRELNALVRACKDGELGFTACAEHVVGRSLRLLLMSRADDCHRSAAELQAVVRQLGGEPEDAGTAYGAALRHWFNLRNVVLGCDDIAMLGQCERREAASLSRYLGVLASLLPATVHEVVRRQYDGARRHHAYLQALCARRPESPET